MRVRIQFFGRRPIFLIGVSQSGQLNALLVITSDPGDIAHLAAAVPAARVVTRQAR
jgi:hypothetical protein